MEDASYYMSDQGCYPNLNSPTRWLAQLICEPQFTTTIYSLHETLKGFRQHVVPSFVSDHDSIIWQSSPTYCISLQVHCFLLQSGGNPKLLFVTVFFFLNSNLIFVDTILSMPRGYTSQISTHWYSEDMQKTRWPQWLGSYLAPPSTISDSPECNFFSYAANKFTSLVLVKTPFPTDSSCQNWPSSSHKLALSTCRPFHSQLHSTWQLTSFLWSQLPGPSIMPCTQTT